MSINCSATYKYVALFTLNDHTHIMHLVFRSLTVKSVRQQFLKYLGVEKLMAEQKEVFKSIVYDIYNFYSDENQEVDGDQGNYTFTVW